MEGILQGESYTLDSCTHNAARDSQSELRKQGVLSPPMLLYAPAPFSRNSHLFGKEVIVRNGKIWTAYNATQGMDMEPLSSVPRRTGPPLPLRLPLRLPYCWMSHNPVPVALA